MIIPQIPQFTGNKMKNEVLFLIACEVRPDRKNLQLLDVKYGYLSKTINLLEADGLINVSKTRPTLLSFTPKGIALLMKTDRALYNFYMRTSSNNHPGGTKEHQKLMRKAAETMTMVHMAGALIGSQKPTLVELMEGTVPKLDCEASVFYLNKEIVYSDEQKVARQSVSQACGQIYSPTMRAMIYNTLGMPMQISKMNELIAHNRTDRTVKELFGVHPEGQVKASIILCPDDEKAADTFLNRAAKGKRKSIGEAAWDHTLTSKNVHYVTVTKFGIELLRMLMQVPSNRLSRMLFKAEEIDLARKKGIGEAIIDNRFCYEFVSANVSKLVKIRRTHRDLSQVEIVCMKEQFEFVKRFFSPDEVSVHELPSSAFNDFLCK